jgi:hypothetical protein
VVDLTDLINEIIVGHCPEPLISLDAHEDLSRLTNHLSGQDIRHFGYEIRLSDENPLADFGLAFTCGCDRNQGAYIGVLDSLAKHHPSKFFQPLRSVLLLVRNKRFSTMIHHLWLEFDFIDPFTSPFLPNLFCEISPLKISQEFSETFAGEFLSLFCSPQRVNAELRFLHKLNCLLPKESRVFELGFMSNRFDQPFRIGIKSVPIHKVAFVLDGLLLSKETLSACQAFLNNFAQHVKYVDIGIDSVVGDILPRVGFELYFEEEEAVEQSLIGWERLLGIVTREQWGLSQKTDYLGNFPASKFSKLTGYGYELSIYHVKFAIDPTIIMAKAYLSVLGAQ